MSNQSERYIQLHRELWEAYSDAFRSNPFFDYAKMVNFLHWLRSHSGIYQPACREYLDILGG